MASYIALWRKEKNTDYGVDFPDFPGCITAGRTLEEAEVMAQEALQGHIDLMIKNGEDIPEPSSLGQVMANADIENAVAFSVEVRLP